MPKATPAPPPGRLTTGYFRARGKRSQWREWSGREWVSIRGAYAGWREHGTEDWLLILTTGGAGRFGFPDGEFSTEPGDAVLLRPRTPHDYSLEQTLARWDLIWAHFIARPAWLPLLRWPEAAPGIGRLHIRGKQARAKITSRFLEAHRLATRPRARAEDFAMNALEETLLWCDAENPDSSHAALDERIHRAVENLCANLARPLFIRDLAKSVGLSESRLTHLFTAQVGKSPMAYLEAQRIARARLLLEFSRHNIAEIAQEIGFESAFYFSQRFKKHTGQSPRLYRETVAG